MDTIIFLCFVIFMVYFFFRIRNGLFEDRSRRGLHAFELVLLVAALIYMFPDFYRKVSADIALGRFSPDSAIRCLLYIFSVIVIAQGAVKLFNRK